jgi:hypothetical protein
MPCTSVHTPQMECPGVARIAISQDDFNPSDHRAGRIRLCDLIAIHLRFDTEVTFDARNRIYYDSRAHD